MNVIRGEQPPYEFKIHIFMDKNKQTAPDLEDYTPKMIAKLEKYGAKNIKD